LTPVLTYERPAGCATDFKDANCRVRLHSGRDPVDHQALQRPIGIDAVPVHTSMASSATPMIRLQAISFFSIGNSGSACILCNSSPIRGPLVSPVMVHLLCELAGNRRLQPMEEHPRDKKTHPDDEAEQRHHIDRCQLADTFLPQSTYVGH